MQVLGHTAPVTLEPHSELIYHWSVDISNFSLDWYVNLEVADPSFLYGLCQSTHLCHIMVIFTT